MNCLSFSSESAAVAIDRAMRRMVCIKLESSTPVSVETLQSVAACCKQFTPLVGIDPDAFPQSVLLDITPVLDLFGGEEALIERIDEELQSCGRQFRLAVAHTPGAAWALAWYGKEQGKNGGESTQRAFCPASLALLPLAALRLSESTIALLNSLGVWRIEQLQALPRRELMARFGPELLDCLDRVTGRLREPLPTWEPPPRFEVRWSAEYPTTRQETIFAAVEHLVRRLSAMLVRAGRGAMRLECRLTCQGGGPLDVAVGLFRPTAWPKHLFDLLVVRLESLTLSGGVETIELVAATAPLELRQQELFAEGNVRVQPQHLAGLIDRLSNRLGHTRVARVRLIPDAQPELACRYAPLVESPGRMGHSQRRPAKNRRQTDEAALRLTRPARPLRLLLEPVRIAGELTDQFLYAGRMQRIIRRIGPERIETGWWRGPRVARDYYRIETAAGCWYWIFRRLPRGPWFLHGVFE